MLSFIDAKCNVISDRQSILVYPKVYFVVYQRFR